MSKNTRRRVSPYIALLFIIIAIYFISTMVGKKVNDITFSTFKKNLDKQNVEKVEVSPNSKGSIYEITGKLKNYASNESFYTTAPLSDETINLLNKYQSEQKDLKIDYSSDPSSGLLYSFLTNVLPYLLLAGLLIWFFSRQLSSNNKSMEFGKSRAKLQSDKNKVTFENVAGLVEEKEELQELIDFLKDPKKFTKMGARIPKGVLLVGNPGTGKTLLAKAVAGEANVPFYFISGSDFVELFVGIGASRVRDMFRQAKQSAPCLIFIDEIDAVGRQRGTGLGGGHDEREQTLNQLLTEMDGFGTNEGIIIIAATNRPDVLDPALLRPGRFDRQITVGLPDKTEREDILKVHAKNKTFEKNVVLKNIAQRTVGFSGADLENLLNEAALLTVRRNKDAIGMGEIDEAYDRVIMGPAKKTRQYTEKEKRVVAYHEAGHAVVGIKLDGADDVQKITIIPRGQAGGYNLMLPKEEKFLATERELLDKISGYLGGRVAEEFMFGEVTTGASNDFEKATKIARAMVTEYGMSELGPIQLEEETSSVFLGRDYNKSRNFSSQVAFQIDEEVRKIINTQYNISKKLIKENKDLLDLIAKALLDKETLTREEIEYLVKNKKLPKEDEVLEEKKEEKKEEVKKETKTTKKETKKEDKKTTKKDK
ncbi:MAG: ATP-dependent zinc metalloprotease FtsH [Bacilli bacterium]|nr:ATP-dependent zinc metalloprotease FtsH [Bacilli bacterium]